MVTELFSSFWCPEFYPHIRGSTLTVSFLNWIPLFGLIETQFLVICRHFYLWTGVSRIRGTLAWVQFFLPSDGVVHILQVSGHFDVYQTKREMQAEKVQLLAMAKVSGKYKTCWLHWRNVNKDSRQSYNFPKSPCSIEELRR